MVCGAAGRSRVPANGVKTNTPPVRGPFLALDLDRRLGRLGDVVRQPRRLLPLRRHHLVLLHADRAAPGLTRAPQSVATDVRGREGRVSEEESVSRTRNSTGDARYGWADGSERRLLPFFSRKSVNQLRKS